MTEALEDLAQLIASRKPDAVVASAIACGELTLTTVVTEVIGLLEFLRDDSTCHFGTLVDITAVDHPERPARFDVVWHLLSMHRNHRIRVKLALREDAVLPSSVGLFPAANWYEREVFDLFGITFSGHPDLRRLLTDYGFRGHPLRKDFPTTGYVEVRYDDAQRRVIYEPVGLVQEYRQFDFMSPWEWAPYILPGDQKADAGKAGDAKEGAK